MTVTDYDIGPNVRLHLDSMQIPVWQISFTALITSGDKTCCILFWFHPPAESVWGASIKPRDIRVYRQLSLKASRERKRKEKSSSVRIWQATTQNGEFTAKVKQGRHAHTRTTNAKRPKCFETDPCSLGSCPRGDCWSFLLQLRTTIRFNSSCQLSTGKNVTLVSDAPHSHSAVAKSTESQYNSCIQKFYFDVFWATLSGTCFKPKEQKSTKTLTICSSSNCRKLLTLIFNVLSSFVCKCF